MIQIKGAFWLQYLGVNRFGNFLKLKKIIRTKSCRIVFYIGIPNFKTLELIVKNFEIFGKSPLNKLRI